MREIKFRGLNDGKWVYGYLYDVGDRAVIYCPQNKTYYSCSKETIGQYTGLQDCDGADIYEGDIFKTTRYISVAVVEWENNGRFLGFTEERKIVYVGREPKVKVIGNIYENPELLKAVE